MLLSVESERSCRTNTASPGQREKRGQLTYRHLTHRRLTVFGPRRRCLPPVSRSPELPRTRAFESATWPEGLRLRRHA